MNETVKPQAAAEVSGSRHDLLVRLFTEFKWYVHEVRGVLFVTFVPQNHKEQAAQFPVAGEADGRKLAEMISEVAGVPIYFERV